MTEQEALAKLGAPDWRSLKKNQIMTFLFDTAPNLSDEVRLKILELAPDILNTIDAIFSEYQSAARETLEQNQKTVDFSLSQNADMARTIFISYQEASETLRSLLSNPDTSFEEKQYWNGELFKYLREMREFDIDNKNFLREMDKNNKSFIQVTQKYGLIAAGIAVCLTLAALTGSKVTLPLSK